MLTGLHFGKTTPPALAGRYVVTKPPPTEARRMKKKTNKQKNERRPSSRRELTLSFHTHTRREIGQHQHALTTSDTLLASR